MFVVPLWAWLGFGALVLVLLSIDLLAHRGDHADNQRRAIAWSIGWITVSLAFNAGIWVAFGSTAASEFLTAYLLEKSLSVDNLFLFLLVFRALKIAPTEQRRVLSWGILGALVMRGLFIAVGAAALERWHGLLYVFGGILIYAGLKLLKPESKDSEAESPKLLDWIGKRLPWTPVPHGHHFFIREEGRLKLTPLMVALIAVELSDVVFAVDSIPAAFAVTQHPFLIYSSNVFAVLGLRSLYIVLAGALSQLRYLHYGLAAVLIFVGLKILISRWVHLPPAVALGVVVGCIGAAAYFSVRATRREQRSAPPA